MLHVAGFTGLDSGDYYINSEVRSTMVSIERTRFQLKKKKKHWWISPTKIVGVKFAVSTFFFNDIISYYYCIHLRILLPLVIDVCFTFSIHFLLIGEKITWENWERGQGPTNRGFLHPSGIFEDCALLKINDGYRWHDYLCSSKLFEYTSICEYSKLDTRWTMHLGLEYQY